MKMNSKVRYGLRTMIDLALNIGGKGVLQKEIAARQNISQKYLDQIVAALKSANLIANVGGKKSGYAITRPASEITIFDIYKAFEGNLTLFDCLFNNDYCEKSGCCASRDYWGQLNTVIEANMKSVTLDTISQEQLEYNKKLNGDALAFSI